MGCFNRAVFSNINHKKRLVLIFMIVLIASVLLQLSYQISQSASGSVDRIRKDIGASVYARIAEENEYSLPLDGTDPAGYFSYDMAKEIASLPEVKKSNYLCMVNVKSEDIDGVKTGVLDDDEYDSYYPGFGNFQLVGVTDMQSFWNFKSGKDNLLEGVPIKAGNDEAGAVLSKRVMDSNLLKLGDAITVSSYFDNNVSAELKVVGIHSGEELNLVPEYKCNINYIYAPLDIAIEFNKEGGISQAEYVMNDPKEAQNFITKAQSIAEEHGLDMKFVENNLDFVIASTALNSLIKNL